MPTAKVPWIPTNNPLFVLIGESGAGKTALSVGLVNIWANSRRPLQYLRTITSRPRRKKDPTEDVVYEFATRKEVLDLRQGKLLVEFVEYAGYVYGVSCAEAERVLGGNGLGIIAATEQGCLDFEAAGLLVAPIRIEPKDRPGRPKHLTFTRMAADSEQSQIAVDYCFEVENSFLPGGQAQALADLQRGIMSYLSQE